MAPSDQRNVCRRHSSRSAENVSRAGPPPDIVSDLKLGTEARTEVGTEVSTEVQSCLDFIDCLLRAPDMVEIPREGSSREQERDQVEGMAVTLPLKQQRETLLC